MDPSGFKVPYWCVPTDEVAPTLEKKMVTSTIPGVKISCERGVKFNSTIFNQA